MTQDFKLKMAQQKGEKVTQQFECNSLPVDLLAIAGKNSISVQQTNNCSKGVSGMLLRYGNSFGIMYSTYIKSKGFQRFSIAHELGHYFLDGHLDHVLPDTKTTHKSSAGFCSGDLYEKEADYFASGLLMPDRLIQPIINSIRVPGLTAVKKIAQSCKTSLVSSAIRYTSLSEDYVAVIVSEGTKVEFCFLSQSMKSLPDTLWPVKRSPVPNNSLTAQFNKNTNLVVECSCEEDKIDIQDWLSGNKSFKVKEEVQGLGSYGKTLTVLSYSGDTDKIINNEEDKLLDSWTPGFRR